ncbi:hypothetical protein WAI453_007147 [Rhynchosporium graminicola]
MATPANYISLKILLSRLPLLQERCLDSSASELLQIFWDARKCSGGDYPLSSIITSEFATTKWREAMMGAVFSMQGSGQLGGALVMLFCVVGFEGSLESATKYATCDGVCGIAVDKMWRVLKEWEQCLQ